MNTYLLKSLVLFILVIEELVLIFKVVQVIEIREMFLLINHIIEIFFSIFIIESISNSLNSFFKSFELFIIPLLNRIENLKVSINI